MSRGRRRAGAGERHADWLRLVEPSGPFLTVPVLRRAWPQGLEPTPAETRAELRRRLAELEGGGQAAHTAFVEWVLADLLGWKSRLTSGPAVPGSLCHLVAEHGVFLRPDHVLSEPTEGGQRARVLVGVWPAGTRLDARPGADRWSASPVDRMAVLCRAVGVELGLVTNGLRWALVWAPVGGATGVATFAAELFSEEPALADAFVSVLGARRFFSVAPDEQLEALLAESASAQAEVTTTLGRQVRQAVELLVAAIGRTDRERHGELLDGVEPHTVYEAAVAVLMRMVFLLYAEEHRLLPLDDELYAESLAVSSLLDQLRDLQRVAGDEPLERSQAAWHRLCALFRAVHGGIEHDRLRIPAYGGGLFDPDRYPFLEGRRPGGHWRDEPAAPALVDDLTVLHMLAALQELRMRDGGVTETRRLSYRSLGVEQIGHVYEGLLDHSALRADEPVLGLVGTDGAEPEVGLGELAARAAGGRAALVRWLNGLTGLSAARLERALDAGGSDDPAERKRLLAACDNDAELADRIAPWSGLLRTDLRGLPTVFLPGTLYVTQTGQRRDTGTQYTPPELATEVVEHALAPLVYAPGPADGADPADWRLRPSAELLGLRICDPAVGSGAILVAACRWLAERLAEAWDAEGAPEAQADPEDVAVLARRAVAERCLYGVDRDPLAVEMAKLSMWLVTMARERPFSFLDHAIRVGDSLLGIWDLDQLRHLHLDPDAGRRRRFHLGEDPGVLDRAVAEAADLRARIAARPVVTLAEAEAKADLARRADEATAALAVVADLVVGLALRAGLAGQPPFEDQVAAYAPDVARALDPDRPDDERRRAAERLAAAATAALEAGRPPRAPARRPLHWPLAFPEVFAAGGFDAMVGNPPFLGGQRISGAAGGDYRDFCVRWIAGGRKGSADLVAYFFLRAAQVAAGIGFLATNTIAQGDTREVGLDRLADGGWVVHRAVRSVPWPGEASLEIAKVWLRRDWRGARVLDGEPVRAITPALAPAGRVAGRPHRLAANAGKSFQGSIVLGMGFTLDPEEAAELVARDPRNAEVLFPYLNGEDLNGSPTQAASRWIVNFFDWPEEKARSYPECFAIVEERVKPERMALRSKKYATAQRRATYWWLYASDAKQLYAAIAGLERVLVIALTSKVVQPVFVPTGQVFSHALGVFAFDDDFHFGVLSSAFHWWWAVTHASTLETRIRYTPTDCFETFPLPPYDRAVEAAGRALDTHRSALMHARAEGLTRTYNRVHDPADTSPGTAELRRLHAELDCAVAAAYGWDDLALDHGFYDTPQGRRFTLGPAVRTEVLDRLLELNHARHAAEEAAEHTAGAPGTPRRGARRRRGPGRPLL